MQMRKTHPWVPCAMLHHKPSTRNAQYPSTIQKAKHGTLAGSIPACLQCYESTHSPCSTGQVHGLQDRLAHNSDSLAMTVPPSVPSPSTLRTRSHPNPLVQVAAARLGIVCRAGPVHYLTETHIHKTISIGLPLWPGTWLAAGGFVRYIAHPLAEGAHSSPAQ